MEIIFDKAATRRFQSWGDNAGLASDLLVVPQGSPPGHYDLRVGAASIDKIASDFTRYPGYLRRHAVLRGRSAFACSAPFRRTALGHRGSVFEFDGSEALQCTLQTPSAFALNIIHRPGTRVTDELLDLPSSGFSCAAPLTGGLRIELFFLLACSAQVRIEGREQPVELVEHDAMFLLLSASEPTPAVRFVSPVAGQLYHATITLSSLVEHINYSHFGAPHDSQAPASVQYP
ncbi:MULTISPECIES: HutD family protein [Pseudomonas]|uniref:HutD n=1 Tax=Pseudomonas putida TaxID=303 RepID=A0A1B2F466_PSEPU|nr:MULTISPECIES: HutD family protein [Pseudomonas]ANY87052.1 HutD [Pseudomonas putida]MCL8304367.1 HutD family protein [Pseudomonas putida]